MGLVVAGTLSDYRDAERAPTDLAAGLYAILREAESFEKVWGTPDLRVLRERLIAVVTTLRSEQAGLRKSILRVYHSSASSSCPRRRR